MGNIRPPQFGIKRDENTLTTQDPNAVLYVVTPDSKFIPAKADDEGRLELAAVTLDMSDIQIGAIELKDHTTDDRVAVNTDNELIVQSRVHDGSGVNEITSTTVLTKQGLDVNVVGGSALSVSVDEDDDVPADLSSVGLFVDLNYGYDGVSWERINSTSGALHTEMFAGGSTLAATGTSLNVNITGGSAAGPTDTDDGSIVGGQSASLGVGLNYGWNGATWERLISSSNRLIVDGSQVTQPISVASLPLPTGASTEITLSSIDTTLTSKLDVALSTIASEATLSALNAKVTAVDTGNVTVVSSVLPTGASTEATLSLIDTTLDVALSTRLAEVTFTSRINTLGQKIMASSTPVVLASDHSVISVISDLENSIVNGNTFVSAIARNSAGAPEDVALFSNTSGGNVTIRLWEISYGSNSVWDFFLNPTVTANGTAKTAVNRNTSSATVAGATFYDAPTITANGTLISGHWNSAAGPRHFHLETPFILAPGDTILVRRTTTGAGNALKLNISWTE